MGGGVGDEEDDGRWEGGARREVEGKWEGVEGMGDEAGRTGSELPPKPSCCPNSLRRMMMMMIL